MLGNLYLIGTFLIFMSIMTLLLQAKHLLNMLLSLESMTLGIFILLFYSSMGTSFEGFICLVMISLSICEASIGLAILVALIRVHGNDYVSSFNSYKC
uniref:NADH dehydrogenase subunit 4L n=1 Tax=Ennucula tenuis TaxID=106224 RepID=UPI00286CF40A|nr:NADH dehydrogenase subunit 4L [Ennucula tenuis]WLV28176.1 NADH dehydrogenase subunit 4L [Ennucula tenuis]